MIADLINQIPGMKSYLELGIGNGRNFDAVACKSKTSVDVNGRATFLGTTDDFFARLSLRKKFDVIFIDANHDFEYVLRDFNSSVEHCRKWILIHDMIPPSEKYTAHRFCSDSYRLLWWLWERHDIENGRYIAYTMSDHYGLTFVEMPARPINEVEIMAWYKSNKVISYGKFMESVKTKRLYSAETIIEKLHG
jgi:hypothetical protein